MRWWRAVLERAAAVQEVDDVPFMRLQPVELQRLHLADVQAVDVGGVDQIPREPFILGQGAADQRVAAFLEKLILRTIDHRNEREVQIIEALRPGPKAIPEIVKVVYAAYPVALHAPAGQSVCSHLLKLEREGRASRDGAAPIDAIWRLS